MVEFLVVSLKAVWLTLVEFLKDSLVDVLVDFLVDSLVDFFITHVQKLGGKGLFEYGLSVTTAVKTHKTPSNELMSLNS